MLPAGGPRGTGQGSGGHIFAPPSNGVSSAEGKAQLAGQENLASGGRASFFQGKARQAKAPSLP